ncbi:MAG: amylo-alpha-1,6-glucosidase [Candidatus Rokuibacteriota bacterium]
MNQKEHRTKERILTQHDPAKVRRSADAIVLKSGSAFLLATEAGDVPFERPHAFGLFWNDCRFLDGYTLRVNDAEPTVLSGIGRRGYEAHHHLTNPEIRGREGVPAIPRHAVVIRRHRVIRGGVLHELITARNHGRAPASVRLELRFRATFEDLFIVKGFVSGPRGRLHDPDVRGGDEVRLAYEGRDGVARTTRLIFSPAPRSLAGDRAAVASELAPGQELSLAVTITPSESRGASAHRGEADPRTPPAVLTRWLERSESVWLQRSAKVRGSNPLFERVLRRALVDLGILRSSLDGQDYFAAGIPWFSTLFGRDSATVALQTLPYGPGMGRQTLRLLARYQATATDEYRDAAPGKILHELRHGELAGIGAIPQAPAYYGTVDATMLFLILLAEYVRWSGDLGLARELRGNVGAALEWMAGPADSDGDGYLDYRGRYANGLVNQGWKDSGNAVVNADGSLAEPPIALCEVQAYAYRAWRQTAWLLRRLGEREAADRLDERAAEFRQRMERDFWDEHLGCYVLALQKDGRPVAVVTSNAGQVLWGGAASPARAARVARRLLADDMFSGWGIRTLSSDAAAYNPVGYHLGSVWPHDNALIVSGLRRYGCDGAALRVFDAVFDAASRFRNYRLPELYCGQPRHDSPEQPVQYPVACSPQAWAAGAIPHALWNLLGLEADATEGRLRVRRPILPAWLEWVEVDDVTIGEARVDLRVQRAADGEVEVKASVRSGQLAVERIDAPASPDAFDS